MVVPHNINDDKKQTQPKKTPWVDYIVLWILVAAAGVLTVSVFFRVWQNMAQGAYPGLLAEGIVSAICLILIAFLVYLVATIHRALRKEGSESDRRFAIYQLVAFSILILSLRAFGIHHSPPSPPPASEQAAQTTTANQVEDNSKTSTTASHEAGAESSEKTTRFISELAAIIILFLLAELAAFVAHDVIEARRNVEELRDSATEAARNTTVAAGRIGDNLQDLADTTAKIQQLRLYATIQTIHSSVRENVIALFNAWAKKAPSGSPGNETSIKDKKFISDLSWQVLLQQYLKEELLDIDPTGVDLHDSDGKHLNDKHQNIPASVRPVTDDTPDVSYIATNIGFYAKFLSAIVEKLADITNEGSQRLCMAIMTSALPAHCWNWPMNEDSWSSYYPIDDYRKSMSDAISKGAQIDRALLVFKDPSDPAPDEGDPKFFESYNNIYWRKELLDQMRNDWYILSNENAHGKIMFDPTESGSLGSLESEAYALFPLPIRNTADRKSTAEKKASFIYPMICSKESKDDKEFPQNDNETWEAEKMVAKYLDELHGDRGHCWEIPLNKDDIKYFKQRHDVMFIGLGSGYSGGKGLWDKESQSNWGMCLMSSMNSNTETMFLTVISGESIDKHYEWFQERLNTIISEENKLHPTTAPTGI